MEKLNKTCLVCGTKYSYCNTCKEYSKLPLWKSLFDTENCKNIFHATSDYLQGAIDEKVAKEKLSVCDLNDSDNFKESIKNVIKELTVVSTATSTKENNVVEKVESKVEEINDTDVIKTSESEESDIEEVSEKRNYKKRNKQSD